MITPHLQPLDTNFYTKKWTVVANKPCHRRPPIPKKYGIVVYNMRRNSIHFFPDTGARLELNDLQTIFVLMNNALAEQVKLSVN